MQQSLEQEASKREEPNAGRASYVSPAIVYEGKLTIRAGSPLPIGGNSFDGPPSPFSAPGE